MQARVYTYVHESNGIAVEVIPETEAEDVLLDSLWRFGKKEIVHSEANPSSRGYIVRAFACLGKTEAAKATEGE